MRKTLFAFGIVIALLIASAWLEREAQSPPVRPALEQVCAETMQRTPADHSWVAPNREEMVRSHQIQSVTLGELPAYDGRLVRVAGVLHAEFEWVALYPSRAAMEEPLPRPPMGCARVTLARGAVLAHQGASDLRSVRRCRGHICERHRRPYGHVQRPDSRCSATRGLVTTSPSVRHFAAAAAQD